MGEELNQSPYQGIIELVKNSHDADAPDCTVELNNVGKPGGSIQVSDKGMGMDIENIRDNWLVLGSSSKTEEKYTKGGRLVAGSKGLGRLSALRLGHITSLTSISEKDLKNEHSIEIDWDELDKANAVEDVALNIDNTKYSSNKEKGSLIIIDNLREALNKNEVKKLARSLLLLSDPFEDDPTAFKAKLIASEYKDLQKLVDESYFSACEFHLKASVNKNGIATAVAKDCWGNTLYTAKHDELSKKKINPPYEVPEASFDIWIFLRGGNSYASRHVGKTEVNNWLDELGGVHFYKNGLRVSPYGDKGNDWLGINLLRAKNPELRPSTDSSIGKLVVRDEHHKLRQKTDRSGFIEDDVFLEVQRFAKESLEWLAKRRVEERDNNRRKERKTQKLEATKESQTMTEIIESLPLEMKGKVGTAYKKHEKKQKKLVEGLRKDIQLYRTLSTAGITAAVFAHESANNPIKLIAQSMSTVKTRTKKLLAGDYDSQLSKPIERILLSIKSLQVLGNVTLSLVSFDKRRATRVNIHEVILGVKDLYAPFLADRKTDLDLDLSAGNPFFRGSIAALESIITNLINNALVAFESVPPQDRRILIRSTMQGDELKVFVMDNGPGIVDIKLRDIWIPGETTNENGTGLGMTIVKDAVEDLNGAITAVANGELGGAEIQMNFPILGS